MGKQSACADVTGGKEMDGNLWSWSVSARAYGQQFSPEERERIGGVAAQKGTAGKDRVGEIDVAFVLGHASGCARCPSYSMGEIEDEEAGENLLEDEVRFLTWRWMKPTAYFRLRKAVSMPHRLAVEGF